MTAPRLDLAIGFVDWNTAIIASGAELRTKRPDAAARRALEHVERIVATYLQAHAHRSHAEATCADLWWMPDRESVHVDGDIKEIARALDGLTGGQRAES